MGCRNNKMSKVALLLVAFIALSNAQVQIPATLFGGNYDNFRTFVDAFMSGYTNTAYVLPAACLDTASQGKLDADMINVITSLLKFHPYTAFVDLKTFGKDLESMSLTCGLNQVPVNLNNDLAKKGSWWMIGNMISHSIDIESYIIASLADIIGLKFTEAGKNFGNALRFLIPPTSTIKGQLLGAEEAGSTYNDYVAFSKGFLDGLESASVTGPCYNNIVKLSAIFQSGYQAFEKVLSRNIPAMDDVIANVKAVYPQMKVVESSCQSIDTLFERIQSLATKEGLKSLYTNYYQSLKVVDADFMNVAKCSKDLYTCGKSAGNMIDILFNWNLKAAATPSFLSY